MRSAPKYVAIGVGAGIALGAAGLAYAGSGEVHYRAYARYVDAGNTSAPITEGKRTWEVQSGFVGGTASTSRYGEPVLGLSPEVARTVLTGPTAFSTAIPNGRYRVVMWVRGARDAAVVAEGAARTMTPLDSGQAVPRGRYRAWNRASVPVAVTDGSLDLQFPAGTTMRVAALAIEGRAEAGASPTSTPTAAPTTAASSAAPTPTSTAGSTGAPTSTTRTSTTTSTTTSSAPSSPSKTCPKPKFTTSDSNGGWSINGYYVHNNMWNASEAGPETLYACSHDNWYVTSTQPNTTSVKTYPNVHKDYDGKAISSFSSLTSTFAATSPHSGIYNVAYDIWLNGLADSRSTEMMIWTDNYKQVPSGDKVATATFDGVKYDVWKTSNSKYLAFVPESPMTSGKLDLLAIFKWTQSKGWLASNATVHQIGYGVEICSTNGKPATFNVTDFSIS